MNQSKSSSAHHTTIQPKAAPDDGSITLDAGFDINKHCIFGIDFGTTNTSVAYCKMVNGTPEIKPLIFGNGASSVPSCVSYSSTNFRVGISRGSTVKELKRVLGLSYSSLSENAKNRIGMLCEGEGDSINVLFKHRVVKARPRGKAAGNNASAAAGPKEVCHVVPAIDVATLVFAHVKRQALDSGLLQRVDEAAPLDESKGKDPNDYVMYAVLTYPARFNATQIRAIEQAATAAGITVHKMITEPDAATLNYLYSPPPEKSKEGWFIVLDLGGGSFDVSLMKVEGNQIEMMATESDSMIGGADIDRAIFQYIVEDYADLDIPGQSDLIKQRLLHDCENAKMFFGSGNQNAESFSIPLLQWNEFVLTKDMLAQIMEPFFERIDACILRAFHYLKQRTPSIVLEPSDVEQIIMVGLATKLAPFRAHIMTLFNKQNLFNIDPQTAVCNGSLF